MGKIDLTFSVGESSLDVAADKENFQVNCCLWDWDGHQEFTLNIKQCYELIEFLNNTFDMGYRRV